MDEEGVLVLSPTPSRLQINMLCASRVADDLVTEEALRPGVTAALTHEPSPSTCAHGGTYASLLWVGSRLMGACATSLDGS